MTQQYNFFIKLPLPPSLNQAYRGSGIKGDYSLRRSVDYNNWLENAGFFFRSQFSYGIEPSDMIKGRILAQYIVVQRDQINRDIDNYSKIVSDWLQGKFFENDNQIDELHITRRIDPALKRNFLHVYLTEIQDKRRVDLFNPA